MAISHRSTRGSISSYNIAGLISKVSEEVATQSLKSPQIAVVNNHTLIRGPRQEESSRVSAYTLYFQKLESLAYVYVAASVGLLSSFKFVLGSKDVSFLQQSAFWPFEVIQSR